METAGLALGFRLKEGKIMGSRLTNLEGLPAASGGAVIGTKRKATRGAGTQSRARNSGQGRTHLVHLAIALLPALLVTSSVASGDEEIREIIVRFTPGEVTFPEETYERVAPPAGSGLRDR
jgi:hypothetical protein